MQKPTNHPVHGVGKNCFLWIALFLSEEGNQCLKEILQVNLLLSLVVC